MTWHLIDDPDNQPPKDGTAVLLFSYGDTSVGRYQHGLWVGLIDGWSVYDELGNPEIVNPTHWAPMLPPPGTQD